MYFRGVLIGRGEVVDCVVLWRLTCGGDPEVERIYCAFHDTERDVISERWVYVSDTEIEIH